MIALWWFLVAVNAAFAVLNARVLYAGPDYPVLTGIALGAEIGALAVLWVTRSAYGVGRAGAERRKLMRGADR